MKIKLTKYLATTILAVSLIVGALFTSQAVEDFSSANIKREQKVSSSIETLGDTTDFIELSVLDLADLLVDTLHNSEFEERQLLGDSLSNIFDYAFNNDISILLIAINDAYDSASLIPTEEEQYFIDNIIIKVDEMIAVEEAVTSGVCGENLMWNYDEATGVLTISGTGEMYDWEYEFAAPWENYKCNKMKKVIIENGVTSVGDYAFCHLYDLEEISISDSVTSIGEYGIYYCFGISSITISEFVDTIGFGAFWDCGGLESFSVDADNKNYSTDKYGVLFNKDKTVLIKSLLNSLPENYAIPEGVEEIGESAFEYANLVKVEIPDGVKTIRSYAFRSNENAVSVTIPESVTLIEYAAFAHMSHLETINFNAINANAGDQYEYCYSDIFKECGFETPGIIVTFGEKVKSIPPYLFEVGSEGGNPKITDVIIGSNVETIGAFAFHHCCDIENIKFGKNLWTIQEYAFEGCSKIESIQLPEGLWLVREYAFADCIGLKDVYYAGDNVEWDCIEIFDEGNEHLTNANIHFAEEAELVTVGYITYKIKNGEAAVYRNHGSDEGILEILPEVKGYPVTSMMESCIQFEGKLIIPASIIEIHENAFNGAFDINFISVDINNPKYSSDEYGVLFNKDKTLLLLCPERTEMTSYDIPSGVTEIADWAFKGCELKKVNFPDSLTRIGGAAFYWCGNLESAEIPEKVTVIEDFSFAECYSLTNVVIPEGVTYIGVAALQNCNFKEIYIPKSVIYIGDSFFHERSEEMNALTDVYYGGTEEEWNEIEISEELNELIDEVTIHFQAKNPNVKIKCEIPTPSTTTIKYGDSIWLHAEINTDLPANAKIIWTPSNGNFEIIEVSADGMSCRIIPVSNGSTTFTVFVVDAEDNILSTDTQDMTSKAGLWQKIVAFFKKLFGLNETLPQLYKGITY